MGRHPLVGGANSSSRKIPSRAANPAQWSDGAIARTTPVLSGWLSWVTVPALSWSQGGEIPVPATACDHIAEPTLTDDLALGPRYRGRPGLWCTWRLSLRSPHLRSRPSSAGAQPSVSGLMSDSRDQQTGDIVAPELCPEVCQASRGCVMRQQRLSCSQVIEQKRRRWVPFRRALSKEAQGAFDRMLADATPQLQAAVELGRPWRFEGVIMAVLVAHEKRIAGLVKPLVGDMVGGGQSEPAASLGWESPDT